MSPRITDVSQRGHRETTSEQHTAFSVYFYQVRAHARLNKADIHKFIDIHARLAELGIAYEPTLGEIPDYAALLEEKRRLEQKHGKGEMRQEKLKRDLEKEQSKSRLREEEQRKKNKKHWWKYVESTKSLDLSSRQLTLCSCKSSSK